MAGRFDFDLVIGDSYPPGDGALFTVTYSVRPTVGATPVPYDITNATLGAELSQSKGGTSLVAFELVKLNQVTNPGQFTWRIPATQSALLSVMRGYWRLFLSWAGSNSKTTLVEGLVEVRHAN